jgi:hypothetical protein
MTPCVHLEAGVCQLASRISGHNILVTDQHCQACVRHGTPPRSINQITVSLGFAAIHAAGEDASDYLARYGHHTRERPEGPGTELQSLIAWFHSPTKSCGTCSDRARKMNRWGPDKCRRRKKLIVAWLRQSAAEAGLPFSETIAGGLVDIAIAKAERKSLAGSE